MESYTEEQVVEAAAAISQTFRIVAVPQNTEPDYAMEDCVAAAQAP